MKSASSSSLLAALYASVASCHVLVPRAAVVPTYTGETGPLEWGRLPGLNAELCSKGTHQSPINIGDDPMVTLLNARAVTPDIKDVQNTTIRNNGLTVEVNMTLSGSTTTLNGVEYELDQFHFHTPSEHRISFEEYPLEAHFVHTKKGDKTSRLVLGVLFELSNNGDTTPAIQHIMSIVKRIPNSGDITGTGRLKLADLSAQVDRSKIHNYQGSLTTPPCSEGVNWLVAAKPLPLDTASYNRAKNVLKFNSRYTQNKIGQKNLLDFYTSSA